ncbi:hypothetical protein JIX56_06885 [Streptomyces sp. CA-210063]|uniref:hypothetical protein n=1 Tax=Streptomyces sp. CA-210063 TaxID=2801029 RepID=UPI00214C7387|nr:hypothetical protein [Streptomyces sp. CA-210063]UUU29631.1 hypothetical protein JIX56_06885 [Streptomyces sp. CA-210063]
MTRVLRPTSPDQFLPGQFLRDEFLPGQFLRDEFLPDVSDHDPQRPLAAFSDDDPS